MGVVVLRRYIDILTIIINFPYSTCISSFFGSSIPTSLLILKMFFQSCFCYFLQYNVTQRTFEIIQKNRGHANINDLIISIIKNVECASTARARESRDFHVRGTE